LGRLVVDQLTWIGSRCGPVRSALVLRRSRQVDVNLLIDDRLPLSDGVTRAAVRGIARR
jgi:hypothetical protein